MWGGVMDGEVAKRELLEKMRVGRGEWEEAVRLAGDCLDLEARDESGWSVKDLVAHVATYEGWMAMLLNAGGPNIPHVVDAMTQDERNAWIFEQNRGRAVEDVLASSEAAFRELVAAVEAISAEDLLAVGRFEWAGRKPVCELIPRESYLHCEDHLLEIRGRIGKGS
jgi:uncharacterized damage-inducible protein DinB